MYVVGTAILNMESCWCMLQYAQYLDYDALDPLTLSQTILQSHQDERTDPRTAGEPPCFPVAADATDRRPGNLLVPRGEAQPKSREPLNVGDTPARYDSKTSTARFPYLNSPPGD